MKILIVEDEKNLAEGLRFNLVHEGHEAEVAPDGETALSLIFEQKQLIDAVVLDVMLPGINGFEVAQELRKRRFFAPILMLTARGNSEDVLLGFESGADDYLPKPFDLHIFLARLNGLLRRREWLRIEQAATPDVIHINGRTIDFENLELRFNGQIVQLTLMEAKLLRYLVENAGKVVSRGTILEEVWKMSEDTDTRAIDNFIVRLRKYIEEDSTNLKHLLTVRCVGYRFVLQ